MVVWLSDYLADGRGEQRERMSHPEINRQRQRAQKTPAQTLDDMTQWSQAWGTGPTETNRPQREREVLHPHEMKKQSHTCFQFPPNWNSVMNNGRLCGTESERERERETQKEGKWEPGWCSPYLYVRESVSISMFRTLSCTRERFSLTHKNYGTVRNFQLR